MHISIVTIYGANNVGAYLQAFSLQSVLEGIVGEGNVDFIRFPQMGNDNSKLSKLRFYLKQGKLRQAVFKIQTAQKYKTVMPFLKISNEEFDSNKKYDVVIVGSDEVWNLDANNFTHYNQYFAKDIKANKIIAYAPSSNNTKSETINKSHFDFSNFSSLSVRDKNTFSIVSNIDGRIPRYVCDPTLLIDNFEQYIKPISTRNYILVYSYEMEKNDILEIKQFAKTHGKKLISVGTYNSWCDKNIVVNPFEFLSWLKQADYVIASTFHGAVLSVKLQKNVAIYPRDSHKVLWFIEQMHLQNRDVGKVGGLAEVLDTPISYADVDNLLEELRAKSMAYLLESLEIKG